METPLTPELPNQFEYSGCYTGSEDLEKVTKTVCPGKSGLKTERHKTKKEFLLAALA